jgi:phosphonate transport system substrate-binding protein
MGARRIDPQQLRIFWTSPGYCHCNFTARADFPAALAERFAQAMLAMDYQKPEYKQIMDLEGLTRWAPARTEGCQELEAAAQEFDMLS